MKTFIRVVEAWVPSSDRSMLEYGGGLYGEATRFALAPHQLSQRQRPARPGLGQRLAGVHGRPGQGLALPAR